MGARFPWTCAHGYILPPLRGWIFALAALVGIAGLTLAPFAHAQEEPVAETPASKTVIDAKPIVEAPITDGDLAHWAFSPIVRPGFPAVINTAGLRTAIDPFILAKLEKNGLSLAAEASRATLLRRLSFDLAGLPPSPEELAAFEADKSPDAYERLVDRLLASPALGERWGQHWLDLARFAETDGFEHDKVRPDAWKYRDWVVAALNADMPYDEFIRQQLAGDEKSGVGSQKSENPKSAIRNPQSEIPTMFVLAGPDMPDQNDQAERRHNVLNEVTATVGSAFLGLQIGCAQCHDHKYDPLSQADFYRLRAVFEPAVPAMKRDVPVNFLQALADKPTPARLWVRGDHRRPGPELAAGFPRIACTPTRSASEGASTPTRSVSEGQDRKENSPSLTLRVSMRTDLARWLIRTDNPLTSRVMANRLWQHQFGRGICDTPSDFGVMSAGPTHPQLLDWLAVELREGGWGLKRMQRMVVSSATYRQRSNAEFGMRNAELPQSATASTPHSALRTPHSPDLYSHFPRHRLDGEAIRDSLLAVAGLVSSERGGPGVMPPLPEELVSTLLKGQWTTSKREADHYRRSIYVFARRNLRYPLFEAFDRPDANASCPIRNRSTTAPQSLVLFNSQFSLFAARHLAGRIAAQADDPPRQVEMLYQIALSRLPNADESALLCTFLAEQRQRLATEGRPAGELALPTPPPASTDRFAAAALVDACLALLNSSEFLYVD